MRIKIGLYVAVLGVVVSTVSISLAEERIARITRSELFQEIVRGVGREWITTLENSQTLKFAPPSRPSGEQIEAEMDKRSFIVYTKPEVDTMLSNLEKQLQRANERIDVLNDILNRLSTEFVREINALSKEMPHEQSFYDPLKEKLISDLNQVFAPLKQGP